MDAETTRMLITAGTAIVAGLGGAGLTALINRMNTKDTLNSGQMQEHATWLRNKKQEAYSEFLVVAESIVDGLNDWPEVSTPKQAITEVRVKRGSIKVVGSSEVRDAAMGVEVGVWLTTRIQEVIAEKDANGWNGADRATAVSSYRVQVADLIGDLTKVASAVRRDLGADTPEDTEVDDHNLSVVQYLKGRTKDHDFPYEIH